MLTQSLPRSCHHFRAPELAENIYRDILLTCLLHKKHLKAIPLKFLLQATLLLENGVMWLAIETSAFEKMEMNVVRFCAIDYISASCMLHMKLFTQQENILRAVGKEITTQFLLTSMGTG